MSETPSLLGDELSSSNGPGGNPLPAYRVLARKYRPARFDQLIGQEAMVRTLANAIARERLPHAWMLTGVRGIGKTTTARLIARALNCVGPDGTGGATITPCGVCEPCRAIAEDRHVDVLELDAASHTGVDDIRDIIDGVRYSPASARYKVYILDEVHMLSKHAFNALLKTLEEPPPHVKFIFATTEIRKVPVTVLSRCQRFDLRRIELETLAAHFTTICAAEVAEAEPEALRLIARAADGSVRDGLSLLDQAMARGEGTITASDVKDMLGLADRSQSLILTGHVLRGQAPEALACFANLRSAGADPLQTLCDLAERIHRLTRACLIGAEVEFADTSDEERREATSLAALGVPALTRAWQILVKGLGEAQVAPAPAEAVEMILIRLAYAAALPPPADLIRRLQAESASAPRAENPVPPQGSGSGGNVSFAGTARFENRTSGNGTGTATALARQPLAEDSAPSRIELAPSPRTLAEIAALCGERREARLKVQVEQTLRFVRCAPGRLEVTPEPGADADLLPNLARFLSIATGERWMVVLGDQPGAPTLVEAAKAEENTRRENVARHPLVQAVQTAFPGAKILNLRTPTLALPPVVDARGDDTPAPDLSLPDTDDSGD